jgi:hypothetical protein
MIFGVSTFFAGKMAEDSAVKQQVFTLFFYIVGMEVLAGIGMLAGLSLDLKILFINAVCGVGSTGRIIVDLVQQSKSMGHTVKVVCSKIEPIKGVEPKQQHGTV